MKPGKEPRIGHTWFQHLIVVLEKRCGYL